VQQRQWLSAVSGLALSVLALGCRNSVESSPPKGALANAETSLEAPVAKAPRAAASAGHIPVASVDGTTPSAVTLAVTGNGAEDALVRKLPRTDAVIERPFPEGASDAQVCEAIANTKEKDLWLRFGHLLPMYVYGSILIVDAREKDIQRIVDVVESYHGGKYYPSIKHCSSGGVLLYLRSLADNAPGDLERGHRHLSEVIRARLRLTTSVSFTFSNDSKRLSDFCRSDPELCERLVKLDYANEGRGLCSRALTECRVNHGDKNYATLLQRCRDIPRALVACLEVHGDHDERDQCEARLRETLCP
jgi:hypothetical protein